MEALDESITKSGIFHFNIAFLTYFFHVESIEIALFNLKKGVENIFFRKNVSALFIIFEESFNLVYNTTQSVKKN